jgi:hypothetical protein
VSKDSKRGKRKEKKKMNFLEMKLNQHLKDWKQIVSSKFPNLSLPQLSGLATWSFGMVMTQSSSLTKVATLIAKVNQEPENTVRQRLDLLRNNRKNR